MPLTESEKSLLSLARELVTAGRLPRVVPKSVWAGPGSGEPCSLCELTIDPEHVEYELTEDQVPFRFHLRCHAIWQLAAEDRTNVG